MSKNAATADYVLLVNTPYNGRTLEASDAKNNGVADKNTKAFADKVQSYIEHGKKVIISDSAYGNGADNALVKELFRRGLAYQVAAYGGWNTSGNTLGFALAQGMESPYYTGNAAQDLLTERYLDDWAYQANARMDVYQPVAKEYDFKLPWSRMFEVQPVKKD